MVDCERIIVIKRDGREVKYDEKRILKSIEKAFMDVFSKDESKKGVDYIHFIKDQSYIVTDLICYRFDVSDKDKLTVKEIQEETILSLNGFGWNDVADSFKEYSEKRDIMRTQMESVDYQIEKLENNDADTVNENANKDGRTFGTRRDLIAGQVSKPKGLMMLPPHVANAHLKGEIHYHDLDYHPYTPYTNCCLVDFEHMFKNGFKMGNAEIEEPKSIGTAVAQISQVLASVASSQYGGTSVDRIDELLTPYAEMNYKKHLNDAKDWLVLPNLEEKYAITKTKKDIYDAMQSLEYEINTLYTSNGQTPFVSIGFGLSTDWIGREIQKAIFNVRLAGLGRDKRTAIFPKLLFSIKSGLNREPDTINYDIKQLALKCASKRMYPDILNYHKLIELTGSFKASMGK